MKQKLLRLLGALALGLTLAAAVPLTTAPAWAAPAVDPTPVPTETPPAVTVTLNRTSFDLSVNRTETLTATVVTDEQNRDVVWESSDETVATVNGGVVSGVSAGTATITARSVINPGAYAECEVRVLGPDDVMNVKLYQVPGSEIAQDHVFTLSGENTLTLRASVTLAGNRESYDVDWSASPSGVIELTHNNAGGVRTVTIAPVKDASGIVTLTASSRANPSISVSVKVQVPKATDIMVTGITLSPTTLDMKLGESRALTATVLPYNATDKTVTWTCEGTNSEGNRVATVDDKGNVIGLAAGTATVTARAGAYSATCQVTVSPVATSIRVNPTTTLSKVGETLPIQATLVPANSTDLVTWESSDTSVVTIESATGTNRRILHFQGPGEATVTAKTGNYSAECRVIVSGIALDKTSLTMVVGSTSTLILDGRFGDASTGTKAEWASSDPGGVSIRANGDSATLTSYKQGNYTVTVTVGNYTATCTVNVVEDTSAIIQGGTVRAGSELKISTLSSRLNAVCQSKTGAGLSYLNNWSVSTAQGIMHNNHRSEADTGAGVGASERYYPSKTTGEDALSALSFVPRSSFNGTADISFTGWATNGQSFNGVIRVTVSGLGEGSDVSYSANGDPVAFQSDDFNTVSNAKNGHNLKHVTFTTLPSASAGTLYYNYVSESRPGEKVLTTTQYKRSGTPGLDRVTFVPTAGYSGTVRISYRAEDTSGVTYTGTVTITVSGQSDPAQPGDIYYRTVHGSWVNFRITDFDYASRRAIGETLAYVRFTPPASSAGALFYNYRGFADNGGMVDADTSYYQNGSPSLGNVAFVPSTTAPGQVEIEYTGYGVRGGTFTGTIHVTVGEGSTATQPGVGDNTSTGWGYSYYFSDMDGFSWAGGAVDYLYENGVVYGTGGTSFSPGLNVMRRDFVVMLCRAFDFTTRATRSFSDVPTNTYYSSPIAAAKERGIVSGSNNRFYPNNQLTRQDAMVMIFNSLQSAGQAIGNVHTSILNEYRDAGSISGYAKEAVATLVKMGVINGDNNKRLNPNSTITRAEVAAILYRVMTYSIRG